MLLLLLLLLVKVMLDFIKYRNIIKYQSRVYPSVPVHHMPKFEMPKFYGSLSEYPHLIEIFTANILDANISDAGQLTRLISLSTGRARSAIKDTSIGDKTDGLKAALSILKREFGSNSNLNRAALDNLKKFSY